MRRGRQPQGVRPIRLRARVLKGRLRPRPDHDAVRQDLCLAVRHSADGLLRARRLSRRYRAGPRRRPANVPMILSASSLITLEDVRAANPHAWYQAYLAGVDARIEPLVDRVAAAGYDTFVVTPTCRCRPNRENTSAAAFRCRSRSAPCALGYHHPSRLAAEHLAAHAREPRHAAFREHGFQAGSAGAVEEFDAQHRQPRPARLEHVELIRKRWKGKLVVKGLIARRTHGWRASMAATA